MIKGKAFIGETDISTYGAVMIKGCYEALLTPPAMKPYVENTSRLQHGTRYTATPEVARTTSRNISLQFFIEGDNRADYISKLQMFMNAISQGQILFKVPALGFGYKLVYTRCSNYGNFGKNRGKFTVQFVEQDVTDRINL